MFPELGGIHLQIRLVPLLVLLRQQLELLSLFLRQRFPLFCRVLEGTLIGGVCGVAGEIIAGKEVVGAAHALGRLQGVGGGDGFLPGRVGGNGLPRPHRSGRRNPPPVLPAGGIRSTAAFGGLQRHH